MYVRESVIIRVVERDERKTLNKMNKMSSLSTKNYLICLTIYLNKSAKLLYER